MLLPPDFSAEARLLILCSRGSLSRADGPTILQLISSGIDWDRLLALAEHHGLIPLLYRNLNDTCPAAVPKAVFVRLWGRYETTARRNRLKADELLSLLRLFEENFIPALPFKGPSLAVLLYGDVALREFGDLDILVRPRDVSRARALIEALGYVSCFRLSPRWEARALHDGRHYSLAHVHPGRGIMVELHWATDCSEFALPGIDDSWWERRPRADFLGTPVLALTPEELVFLLCMHGTRHHWVSLGWVADFAQMVRANPALDWQQVIGMAQRQGTLRILLLGFELARRLLEAPLSDNVSRRIASDPAVAFLAIRVIRRIGLTTAPPLTTREKLAFELAWFRFWPPWLWYILKFSLLPNMADWSRWDLPPALSLIYFPLHLGRLIGRYGLRPDKRYFAD